MKKYTVVWIDNFISNKKVVSVPQVSHINIPYDESLFEFLQNSNMVDVLFVIEGHIDSLDWHIL